MGFLQSIVVALVLAISSLIIGTLGFFHVTQSPMVEVSPVANVPTSSDSVSTATTSTTSNSSSTVTTAQSNSDCPSATPVIDLEGNPSAATKDGTHVYGEYCYVLANADPNTFVALDYYYGKDANGVWLLADPTPFGALSPVQIVGADPTTFTLIPDPNEFSGSPIEEQFSSIYTEDKNYVYAYGQIVDAANPGGFMIDDPPKTAACEFDANESYQKYYTGQIIPQAGSEQLP